MRTLRSHVLGLALLSGCAHTPRPAVLDQSKLAAQSEGANAARRLAPQAYARAEGFRLKAEQALSEDAPSKAEALAERSLVAFRRASVQAGKVLATERIAEAERAMERTRAEIAKLEAQQASLARETKQLELRIEVEENTLSRPPLTPESGRRGQARADAARSIAEASRLLCAAARLLDPKSDGAVQATEGVEELMKALPTLPPHEALSRAMDARIECLAVLTRARRDARRSSKDAGDEFLTTLSPGFGDLKPHRDDRGVVLTAVRPWEGATLTSEGREVIDRIAQLAASRSFPLLVVLHPAPRAEGAAAESVATTLRKALPKASIVIAESPVPALAELPASARAASRIEFIFVTP